MSKYNKLMLSLTSLAYFGSASAKTKESSPSSTTSDASKVRYNAVSSLSTATPKAEGLHEVYRTFQEHQRASYSQQQPIVTQNLRPVTQPIQQQPQLVQTAVPFGPHQQIQLHPKAQQQLLQMIQKAFALSQQHQQPTAMIVIAQPAFLTEGAGISSAPLPSNAVFSQPSAAPVAPHPVYYSGAHLRALVQKQQQQQQLQQQLQPRYPSFPQIVHDVPRHLPQEPAQPLFQVHQQSNQALFQAQPVVERPQQEDSYMHHHHQQQQDENHQQSPQKSHLSQIAQAAAEQYGLPVQLDGIQGQPNAASPAQSLPPIITGLENFSPEQQEKIKAQLSEHFGPLQPLAAGNALQTSGIRDNPYVDNNKYTSKYSQHKTSNSDYLANQESKGKA